MSSRAIEEREGPIRRLAGPARVVAVLGLVLAGVAAGCGADDETASVAQKQEPATANDSSPAPATEAFARLDSSAFADRMKTEDALVVNVHIPYEGELEQTDAFIAYDKIVGDARLPKDKDTEILLYCRSGRMSEEAGDALHAEGYTKVAHLEGGMNAWKAARRTLIQNPAHASESGTTPPKM